MLGFEQGLQPQGRTELSELSEVVFHRFTHQACLAHSPSASTGGARVEESGRTGPVLAANSGLDPTSPIAQP